LKDHSVPVVDEGSTSPLNSHSEHHFSERFSNTVSIRQKSAPPTNNCGRSSKQDKARIVYNVLIAYRDTICTERTQIDYISKVYSGNFDISIFQQECDRAIPRSRPSTVSTINSEGLTINSLSHESSQSSVKNVHHSQHSRNSRTRRYQQESISDVEEDEVGKALSVDWYIYQY